MVESELNALNLHFQDLMLLLQSGDQSRLQFLADLSLHATLTRRKLQGFHGHESAPRRQH